MISFNDRFCELNDRVRSLTGIICILFYVDHKTLYGRHDSFPVFGDLFSK